MSTFGYFKFRISPSKSIYSYWGTLTKGEFAVYEENKENTFFGHMTEKQISGMIELGVIEKICLKDLPSNILSRKFYVLDGFHLKKDELYSYYSNLIELYRMNLNRTNELLYRNIKEIEDFIDDNPTVETMPRDLAYRIQVLGMGKRITEKGVE